MAQRENKVIYLYLKTDGSRHFFGCLKSLFEKFDSKELGITYDSLRNFGLSESKLYEDAKCIIVKGTIIPMPNSRTTKMKEIDEVG